MIAEALAVLAEAGPLLAKFSPEIAELVRVLEGGKVTREEATRAILALEVAAADAEIARRYPGEG